MHAARAQRMEVQPAGAPDPTHTQTNEPAAADMRRAIASRLGRSLASMITLLLLGSLLLVVWTPSPWPRSATGSPLPGGGGSSGSGGGPGGSTAGPGASSVWSDSDKLSARETVREMFQHAYGGYMRHAPPPHDELRPLSRSWTDSLAELGNARSRAGGGANPYRGVAMTLIDSLSTLAVMGHAREFRRAVDWVATHVSFDHDIRVHVFEVNIRLLGGLLSAHLLASDAALGLYPNYDGRLLPLAKDLGDRLLPAFVNVRPDEDDDDEEGRSGSPRTPRSGHSPRPRPRKVQLPYAWVNLRHGVEEGETADQCTAGIGTLLLEFGMLSHLTNRTVYYDVAERALFSLWDLRDRRTNLLGNSLSCLTGEWSNPNAGIGAGVDSFYEYLFKSHVLFGNAKWLHMHNVAAAAVRTHLRWGEGRDWYVEADMRSGAHTHVQFNSLAAFWPGLQTMYGEWDQAAATHRRHFSLWTRFDSLPERFLLQSHTLHSSERHYILRPELMESSYYLYRATGNTCYLDMAWAMVTALQQHARVPGGFAGLRDVETKERDDKMHSFFLSETLKYLYLIFDDKNFVHAPDMSGRRGAAVQRGADEADSCPLDPSHPAAGTTQPTSSSSSSSSRPRIPNYIFTTEGHVFPVLSELHERFGDLASPAPPAPSHSLLVPSLRKSKYSLFASPSSRMNRDTRRYLREWRSTTGGTGAGRVDFRRVVREAQCPVVPKHLRGPSDADGDGAAARPPSHFLRLHSAFELRRRLAHVCPSDSTGAASGLEQHFAQGHFVVRVAEGAFSLVHTPSGEVLDVRNLGTHLVEVTNVLSLAPRPTAAATTAAAGAAAAGPAPPRPRAPSRVDDSHLLLRPVVLERSGRSYAYKISTAPRATPSAIATSTVTAASAGAGADGAEGDVDGVPLAEQRRYEAQCSREWDAIGSFFSPPPLPLSNSTSPSSARFSSYDTDTFLVAPLVLAAPPLASSTQGCEAPGQPEAYRGSVVLLERGGCTFVDKVVLAQQAGAVGVIVVNDAESTGATAAATSASAASASATAPSIPSNPLPLLMMGDDGSGRTILIPSLMVPHRYGDQIRACVQWHQRMQDARLDALRSRAAATAPAAAAAAPASFRRAPMQIELVKYLLKPTSLTPSVPAPSPPFASASAVSASANLHPRVVGSLDRFFVTAMGGWTVDIEEKQGAFMLKVY